MANLQGLQEKLIAEEAGMNFTHRGFSPPRLVKLPRQEQAEECLKVLAVLGRKRSEQVKCTICYCGW